MEGFQMFKNFEVQSAHKKYSVAFQECESSLSCEIKEGDIVLVDSNIMKLYPSIAETIKKSTYIEIIANENAKSYVQIGELITQLIEFGFSKNNRLIAVGGGVTQDITGFSSSILFRGVEWIFFPTNLLTQCDSCIGSKTSVNCGDYKNQLGSFYPPSKIIIDFNFCNTLASVEIRSGLGEMAHYFLVDGCENLSLLRSELKEAKKNKNMLAKLINRSLRIKRKMIEIDEFDRGPRNVFNYGHSFGHALESTTNFEIPHGIAVAYGMDLANIISARLGLIDISLRNKIRPILAEVWEDIELPDFEIEQYFSALSKDKKNVGNEIKVILTRGLGNMFKTTLNRTTEVDSLVHQFFKTNLYMRDL